MSVSEFRHPNGDQALPQILIHTKDSSTLEERPLGDGSEELGPGLCLSFWNSVKGCFQSR